MLSGSHAMEFECSDTFLFFNNKFCVLKLLFSKININVIKAGTPYTIINNELQLIY